MLAYRILDENSLKLLAFGQHENFYRNLERQEKEFYLG
ncbi:MULTISPECIES: type II toxin-antitoxin system RelE/ParE family toxin [Nitrosomonas]|nr:type II toxin-antitoxin system RelE/ParE family toxin [Nitrosomonas sp. PLL12-2]